MLYVQKYPKPRSISEYIKISSLPNGHPYHISAIMDIYPRLDKYPKDVAVNLTQCCFCWYVGTKYAIVLGAQMQSVSSIGEIDWPRVN